MNWLLPEYLADALPAEAVRIEELRRAVLDHFRSHGYEMVMPPMLEYLESLLTGAGQDLQLRTFKLVDQLSGRTMGVRADITPQVARIDAHLLNHSGVTRLCYCGSVLHTLPATISAGREAVQIGAELYGYAGIEADLDVIRLMAGAFAKVNLAISRIDLGHVGIFRAARSKHPDCLKKQRKMSSAFCKRRMFPVWKRHASMFHRLIAKRSCDCRSFMVEPRL